MGTNISLKDIRVGDTIDVVTVNRVKVKQVKEKGIITDRKWCISESTNLPDTSRRFQLVDRALPEIPTKIGSVIEVNGVTWLLREADHNPYWMSSTAKHRSLYHGEMQQKVADSSSYRVIL